MMKATEYTPASTKNEDVKPFWIPALPFLGARPTHPDLGSIQGMLRAPGAHPVRLPAQRPSKAIRGGVAPKIIELLYLGQENRENIAPGLRCLQAPVSPKVCTHFGYICLLPIRPRQGVEKGRPVHHRLRQLRLPTAMLSKSMKHSNHPFAETRWIYPKCEGGEGHLPKLQSAVCIGQPRLCVSFSCFVPQKHFLPSFLLR